jgi:hypothetical protein
VLQDGDRALLYCCHSLRAKDMAGNPHVLSVGVDLVPALESQGMNAQEVVQKIAAACRRHGGQASVPASATRAIRAIGEVLGIGWIGDALGSPASVICPRSTACPRTPPCQATRTKSRAADIRVVREEILQQETRED